jgi:alpha-L-fucosidase 2
MDRLRKDVWEGDLAELKDLGLGYMPTAFPGFSWDNLRRIQPGTTMIARRKGEFYWRQFALFKELGIRTVFVGMFDEVNEGTAIYKVSNQIPVGKYFVTYEGLPSDWYLKLTGAATRMIRGETPLATKIPLPFPNEMVLWYRQPAEKWLEAMPMGNGILGAMVFGGIQQERIALNESTFWSGRPHDYDNPEAFKYFPQIRDLVFAGKFQEAEKMADEHFYGLPAAQQAYQPLGDLMLTFDGAGKAEEYRRELDLETGVAKTRYRQGDVIFTREIFVSYPDRVIVMRLTSDKPGHVSFQAQFKSPYLENARATAASLVMDGCWKGPITNNWLIAPVEGKGLRFQAKLLAISEGGQSEAADGNFRIQGANAVTLILTAATSLVNYHDISGEPEIACEKTFNGIAGKDYATLRRRHETDFRGLMGRVHLQVGDPFLNEQPTDERLKTVREGKNDQNLEALCFQMGRYLLASSSRAGGQPANLQGIWNEAVSPSWGSKYTININTEMNYWPAEVCNLSECHQPLFDMLKDISVTGAKTARTY